MSERPNDDEPTPAEQLPIHVHPHAEHPERGPLLLEARDVRVSIAGKPIVHGADLTLAAGELVAVVGPNGAGKSTLARAVAGLQPTVGGTIRWGGDDVRKLRGRQLAKLRAFVPQRPRVPEGITVREAVAIGRAPHLGLLQRAGQADRDVVEAALTRADALRFADRSLTTLSGGELQRVHVAVGLAQATPVLIADEPTSALDLGATAAMARLLRSLADDGLAVILVVHDLALAAAIADRVVVLSQGRTVAVGPPTEVLTPERLAEVWQVDAALRAEDGGRTSLHVSWLDPRE